MDKTVQKLISGLKKDKKLLLIMLLGFLGMILLLMSSVTENKKETESEDYDTAFVEELIEERLTSLIKTVEGAGKTKVMVTVDALYERTLAENYETESGENKEKRKNEYVLTEQSGDTDGLILKVTAPVIRGVGITCEGAASASVKQEIIRLVSAALGVSVNRIWVTTMKE